MLDFLSLHNNTENPTFFTIVITVLISFLLSTIIVFTYEKTSRDIARPIYYIQALVLIAIVAATVMQAIGDSLARGLGMLGALAIIRFRTTLRNPRNIVFMFASLAAGIACGVYGFVVAITGTIGFCIVAFILRFSPFSKKNNLVGVLEFELDPELEVTGFKEVIKRHSKRFALTRYRIGKSEKRGDYIDYEYKLRMENEQNGRKLVKVLNEIPGLERVRLTFSDTEDNV